MNLILDESYNCAVVKILPRGIVVELEDKSTEFIHISKLSNSFVKDISNIVCIGQQVEAVAVKGTSKPLELSLIKKQPQEPVKPKEVSVHNQQSLDDMIKQCNKEYEDKFKHKNSNIYNTRNRRGIKFKKGNYDE